ncbi:MAG TPA: hypothetical protein VK599_23465, partial [Streptosporangiaceae bacterium]|nr:hypothetical protein [Streptosporangiaceae bacterium]
MRQPKPTRRQILSAAIALGGAAATTAALGGSASAATPLGTTPVAANGHSADRAADRAADRIVRSIRRPAIPRRSFPITRFGALPGGGADTTASNTAAIAAAVKAANRRGGGVVTVPAGEWATGPIHLLSRVELHLEAGST